MQDKLNDNLQTASAVSPNQNNEGDENQTNSTIFGQRATPVFAIESFLEDDEPLEMAQPLDDNTPKQPVSTFTPRSQETSDIISTANSEVVLRRPQQQGRYLSANEPSRNGRPNIHHSNSTSDLGRYQRPLSRSVSKDSGRSMILPIAQHNRPRSPYVNSHSYSDGLHLMAQPSRPRSPYVNSQSYGDGLHLMANQFNSSNPNLTHPSTPQERFAPYIPGDSGGFQNGGYNNGGFIVSNGSLEQYKQNGYNTPPPSEHHHSTTPEAKKKLFTDILSASGSTIYALFVLTLGISLYVIDALEIDEDKIAHLAEGYSLALVGLALLYLVYLIIDISIYRHRKDKFEKLMENLTAENIELKETSEGIACDVTLHKALALRKKLDHRYCFNMDRHSSNFYLKVGAAGFCFGHLIHSFLILIYRGILLRSSDVDSSECFQPVSFIVDILYPIYSIILLFFVFKYSNVIINRHSDFHRFGFMHCLAASLCFWVWTIFRETAEYIHNQSNKYPSYENDTTDEETETFDGKPTSYAQITPMRFTKMCENDELNVIYQNYSPYLYPFSVEFSILVVGILYIVWINIGLCAVSSPDTEDHHHGDDTRECKNYKPIEHESNVTIHADCHAANKGLFAGFIILVYAIVSVILFFITFFNSAELAETGLLFNTITSVVIVFCMIVATVFAYTQMVKLDVNEVAHNSLDNFLCLMCLPAFFVNGIFSIIPAIIYGHALEVINILFEIIQVLIQTPFIIDGMARSSNSKELRKKKPGREFVTFLVICNVAMWIMQTFEVKSHGLNQYRQDFYSKELWSIVGHICLPLIMFYRFHSSVCIGDIWKYAYMPSGH